MEDMVEDMEEDTGADLLKELGPLTANDYVNLAGYNCLAWNSHSVINIF